jgi:hypothetical protein
VQHHNLLAKLAVTSLKVGIGKTALEVLILLNSRYRLHLRRKMLLRMMPKTMTISAVQLRQMRKTTTGLESSECGSCAT